MRNVAIAIVFVAVSIGGFAESLHYFNVVPLIDGNSDFAISEIRRQRQEVGITKFAIMLSCHPQTTPARALIPYHVTNFRKVREAFRDTDIHIGILVQSTSGMGWSGRIAQSDEPWQRVVRIGEKDGPRYCQLDPRFRKYVIEAIGALAREKPAFMVMDDDFCPGHRGCFCPLHIARFNAATGRNLSREEWERLAKEGKPNDPVRQAMEVARCQVPVEFGREIRAVVDVADPTIRFGTCTAWRGMEFTLDLAHALAGKTVPFIRVCNSTYGMATPRVFYNKLPWSCMLRKHFSSVPDVVAEADTWPQNRWSETATMFNAHLTLDILAGLNGAKLWMSEFCHAYDTRSQLCYERRFANSRRQREVLFDLVRNAEFHGVLGVIPDTPVGMSDSCYDRGRPAWSWLCGAVGPYGLPIYAKKIGSMDPRDVYAVCAGDVRELSDNEVQRLLSCRVLVDSQAAKDLTARGFAELLGAEATDGGGDFGFQAERTTAMWARGRSRCIGILWDDTAALLKPISKKTEVLSEFVIGKPINGAKQVVSPSLTYFKNRLGGCVAVVGWSPETGFQKVLLPDRRLMVIETLDRLAGGFLPYGIDGDSFALSVWASLVDGSTLFVAFNSSDDIMDGIPVRMRRVPDRVEQLMADGTWKHIETEETATSQVTFRCGEVRQLEPFIFRVWESRASGCGCNL